MEPGAELGTDAGGQPIVRPDGTTANTPAQDTALNGAQVAAALQIVLEVVNGTISVNMGKAMLVEFFNLQPARADAIYADAEQMIAEHERKAEEEAKQIEKQLEQRGVPPGSSGQVRKRAGGYTQSALEQLSQRLARELEKSDSGWFG